jgi:iron complex outermembrane receptor protein
MRIDNFLDHRIVGSVIVNEANGRWFAPAPGRGWSPGLALEAPLR